MPESSRIMPLRRLIAHTSVVFAAAGAAVLFVFPPERSSFYPICPVHQWLGIQCPGCGATRALSALLHGHLHEALHDNALFVCLLPAAMLYALCCYRRSLRKEDFRWPEVPANFVYALACVAMVFMVVRNI